MARPMTSRQHGAMLAALPIDRAFSAAEADALGVPNSHRRLLVDAGLLVRRVRGVFHDPGLQDSIDLRLQILALIVPDDCVVTDRTAAWLWCGDMALAPGDHLVLPRVSVFAPPGRRLRNGLVASGERTLHRDDVVEIGGVQVTTPLRTACDLGRLLHRDQALAGMDLMASLQQFSVEQLVEELLRFKGFRGIIQARSLAFIVDGRAQSQMESISRLRWWDAGLPHPECQVEIPAPRGSFFIDIGLPEERFGLEFFGEEFHGEEQEEHDESRLEWARSHQRWNLIVARKHHVVGPRQDLEQTLRREWALHRTLKAS